MLPSLSQFRLMFSHKYAGTYMQCIACQRWLGAGRHKGTTSADFTMLRFSTTCLLLFCLAVTVEVAKYYLCSFGSLHLPLP